MRRFALLVLTAALLAVAAPAYAQADKDCGDFTTQDDAQAYFKANGGSATNNVDRLDADGDGIACEDRPSGSNGQGQSGDTPADRGERLADTGPGNLGLPAAGLLAVGLLLVAVTRYRPKHTS